MGNSMASRPVPRCGHEAGGHPNHSAAIGEYRSNAFRRDLPATVAARQGWHLRNLCGAITCVGNASGSSQCAPRGPRESWCTGSSPGTQGRCPRARLGQLQSQPVFAKYCDGGRKPWAPFFGRNAEPTSTTASTGGGTFVEAVLGRVTVGTLGLTTRASLGRTSKYLGSLAGYSICRSWPPMLGTGVTRLRWILWLASSGRRSSTLSRRIRPEWDCIGRSLWRSPFAWPTS
jgi:hypothetical protein